MKVKKTQLYDLKYYSKKGKLIETVEYMKPIALIKSIKRDKEKTTHRLGILKIEKN